MAHDFDPYYKWLGIPPKDQPPNHYRLLGIERFEADREVIDAAANRIMAYLKSLAAGDEAEYSQKLLNEVAAARGCLLNSQRKTAYDEALACSIAETLLQNVADARKAPTPAVPEPPPVAPAELPRIIPSSPPSQRHCFAPPESTGRSPQNEHSRHKKNLALRIAIPLVACVLLLVLLLLARPAIPNRPAERPPAETLNAKVGEDSLHEERPNGPESRSVRLTLDWPDNERSDAIVLIDGSPRAVPQSGLLLFDLSADQHDLVIRRKDCETIRATVDLSRGQALSYPVKWRLKRFEPAFPDPGAASVPPPTEMLGEVVPSMVVQTENVPAPAVKNPPAAPQAGQPAKPEPAKPQAAKSGPTVSKPASPTRAFAKLPSEVDLPELAEKSSGTSFAIGPIGAQESDPLQLELLDGETALKSGARATRRLVLVRRDEPPPAATWDVQLEENSGEAASKQTSVARFWREQDVLKFQWSDGLDHRLMKRANYLRCCLLRVSLNEQEHQIDLLTAARAAPLTIDLQQVAVRGPIPLKWLPDPDDLLVKITKVEGHNGAQFQQDSSPRSWTLVFARTDLGGTEAPEVQYQFSLAGQTSAVGLLRLVSPTVDFLREWLPADSQSAGRRKRPTGERFNREEAQRIRDEAKASYGRSRSEKSKLKHAQEFERLDRQLWFLAFGETVHQKAKVHYDVYLKVGQREVVLATTTP